MKEQDFWVIVGKVFGIGAFIVMFLGIIYLTLSN